MINNFSSDCQSLKLGKYSSIWELENSDFGICKIESE